MKSHEASERRRTSMQGLGKPISPQITVAADDSMKSRF
jgi:hypothetical protein